MLHDIFHFSFTVSDIEASIAWYRDVLGLELVQYVHPKGKAHRYALNDVGVPHVAFLVTDIQSMYERLANAGVRFRTPPIQITAGVNRGGHVCYFHDPDGFLLELLEPSPERKIRLGL